jgi:RNA polymerase sigma-B factor
VTAPITTTDTDRRALLAAYREQGDLAARDQLVESLMPFVRSVARRYAGRGEQLDDLVQVASVGLLKALEGFDLDRDVELLSYVFPTVVGELKRHFRDRMWSVTVPRHLKELHHLLSRTLDEITANLGRSPTIAELAEAADVEEEEVVEALEVGGAYAASSLYRSVEVGDGELTLIDSLSGEETGYEATENRALIAAGLQALDERDRIMLHLRFYEGLTQMQIAVRIGVSQMHVSRLIRKALATLQTEIEEEP